MIELLWRRGIALSAVCYADGHVGLLVEGGVVRWLPFNHVAQPSSVVADELARGLRRKDLSGEPPRDGQSVLEISPRVLAWWQFLRRLHEQGRFVS